MPAMRPAAVKAQRFVGGTPHTIACDPPYTAVCPGVAGHGCVTIIPRHREHCTACQLVIDQTRSSTL
jgi:hypothetical protein